jgi:hypothetical protein
MTDHIIPREEPEKPLTAREQMVLAEHERTIVRDFAAFYRVGRALAEINRLRLYRTESGRTFEQYCKELWDMSKGRAHQLIDASAVYDQLQIQGEGEMSTNCRHSPDDPIDTALPLNEAQVRPLTRLKEYPEKVRLVWDEARKRAPRGKVTASHVKRAVKEYLGENIQHTVRVALRKVERTCSAEFAQAFELLSQQIIKERNSGYKYTSRGAIVQALDQLRADIAKDGDAIKDPVLQGGSDDMNKLEAAGFALFRMDRNSMTIRRRSENGGWSKESGPFDTVKAMEAAFKNILQDDRHLRG